MTKRLNTTSLLAGLIASLLPTFAATGADVGTIEATLNGLRITFDGETGSILELEYPGPGKIIDTTPEYAGLVDLAYPCEDFEPLRLAPRYSRNANITASSDHVTITWDELGASRPFDLKGKVTVRVDLKALPDGRSILLQCKIDNQSPIAVRQVLFPDLMGVVPFAGEHGTELRGGAFAIKPFEVLKPRTRGEFYPYIGSDVLVYSGGSATSNMITRWLDIGSLKGGSSLFPRVWGDAPNTKVRLHCTETHKTLRVSWMHNATIEPGQQWESAEYVLTPHRNNWAKGIEPYRQWVRQQVKRAAPMPEHVQNGLGFRTLWMCKGYPADSERDVAFRFTDLPAVARESKEHGLDEMVLWFWNPFFQLPNPLPYEHLGTPEELAEAIQACKRIGVNVSHFVSWRSLAEPSASRYGLKVGTSWDYHSEMIPRFKPSYVAGRATSWAKLTNKQYQKDLLDSARNLIDDFSPSICWDQLVPQGQTGELYKLLDQIRTMSLAADPRSTFSGESVRNIEKDADYLDYTWNWRNYGDVRGFTSAFSAPRINANINRNVEDIWLSFMDNVYMNVMPAKPDDANATANIGDYPDVSFALKQCARLRSQFLPYFVSGTLIGDGILTEPVADLHVSTYVLPDRMLMLAMNRSKNKQSFDLACNLNPWIESTAGQYTVIKHGMDGTAINDSETTGSRWSMASEPLDNMEMVIVEFIAQ